MKFLVAVDLSEASSLVLRQASHYAKLLSAKVWLVHVVPPDPAFVGYEPGPKYVRDDFAKVLHEQHQRLHQEAEALGRQGIEAIPLLVQGFAAETILNEATKLDVDLIILGSHGHGAVYQIVVGSVSEAVLHKSTHPVLVVPTRGS